ncbi:hypothetical protein WA016_06016 [Myxococcus stipitatus]
MLDDFIILFGFEWVPSAKMVEEEGEQYLYGALWGRWVYKFYSSIEPGGSYAPDTAKDSMRLVRVAVDAEGIDISSTAVSLPLTQRTIGWPERIFQKVVELHFHEPGDIHQRKSFEIRRPKARAQTGV